LRSIAKFKKFGNFTKFCSSGELRFPTVTADTGMVPADVGGLTLILGSVRLPWIAALAMAAGGVGGGALGRVREVACFAF
jgi:hypothetical protein